MIKKIHHIGIVVKNMDEAMKVYTRLLAKSAGVQRRVARR